MRQKKAKLINKYLTVSEALGKGYNISGTRIDKYTGEEVKYNHFHSNERSLKRSYHLANWREKTLLTMAMVTYLQNKQ